MSAAWNTNDGLVSREEAQPKIQELATKQGIRGTFKVFYDGQIVANPTDLPERVDMKLVKVSAVMDQAAV